MIETNNDTMLCDATLITITSICTRQNVNVGTCCTQMTLASNNITTMTLLVFATEYKVVSSLQVISRQVISFIATHVTIVPYKMYIIIEDKRRLARKAMCT